MIPDNNNSNETPNRGRGRRKNFLKNEYLTTQPKEAKIVGVKYKSDGTYGPQMELKMALDGETVYWGVSVKKNPNFPILKEKFGRDENDWVNQKILLTLVHDDYEEQYFPRVSFPVAGTSATPSRRRSQSAS